MAVSVGKPTRVPDIGCDGDCEGEAFWLPKGMSLENPLVTASPTVLLYKYLQIE